MRSIKVNDKYGKWSVFAGPFREAHGKRKRWHCICDCGREALINDYDLRAGKSTACRTCGNTKPMLVNRERAYASIEKVHRSRLLAIVTNAVLRCVGKEHRRYDDWGGRGITVHSPWIADRFLFVEYLATLDGFDDPMLVLDRVDNDGNYEPGNLRFATRSESQRNRRTMTTGHPYYIRYGFARCFKQLHDTGLSFKSIGGLYCEQESTIRNCVRELETGNAFGS